MDRLVYALAAGALEPGDALALERARARPGLAARIDRARDLLAADAVAGPWLLGAVGPVALGGLHLDAGSWHAGDRLPLVLGAALPPDARLEIAVQTRRGRRILSPVDDVFVRVEQLRRVDAGYALDLVLEAVEGLHRVAVRVLAPTDDTELAAAEVVVRVEA